MHMNQRTIEQCAASNLPRNLPHQPGIIKGHIKMIPRRSKGNWLPYTKEESV